MYFNNALAVTLLDALNQTYQNNIQLNAERENIKASEEDVNIAKADYKPSLTLSGSKSIENTNKLTNQSGGDATINDVDPFSTSIKLEQKLLDYGRDLALEKNITALDLAKAKLVKKGKRIALLSLGTRLQKILEVSELIKKNYKFQCSVLDMRFAKPIDRKSINSLIKNHEIFVTIEENAIGGFSSQVNNYLLNELSKTPKILNFFMKDKFIDKSDIEDQYTLSGISSKKIYEKLAKFLK